MTDTDTLIATVREALITYKKIVQPMAWEHGVIPSEDALDSLAAELKGQQKWIDRVAEFSTEAAAAADAAEAELERVKQLALRHQTCEGEKLTLAAEVERVKAERDAALDREAGTSDALQSAMYDVTEAAGVRLVQARLDKALTVLEQISKWPAAGQAQKLARETVEELR